MPARFHIRECALGRGLFAAESIPAGHEILQFTGRSMTLGQVRSLGAAAANALQIGIDHYLYLDEPGRLVNHSCDPNAVVVSGHRLVARCDIAPGAEICFDYSTTVSDGWTMPCLCGTAVCRGMVVAFQLLPERLRREYAVLRHVESFILDLVGS